MDNYIGEIRLFAGSRPPADWKFCDGSACLVADNASLYAIIGNYYGGDEVTFFLPDLRGRIPVGFGEGHGMPAVKMGEQDGVEIVAIDMLHLPQHSHKAHVQAYNAAAFDNNVKNRMLGGANVYSNETFITAMGQSAVSVEAAGSNQPHTNIMPVQSINYIICVSGLFPDRK